MNSESFPLPEDAGSPENTNGQEAQNSLQPLTNSSLAIVPADCEIGTAEEAADHQNAGAKVSLNSVKRHVRKHHEEARKGCTAALIHAVEAGRWLNEAKCKLPRGKFLNWLQESFSEEQDGISVRTCQRYMKIADRFPQLVELLQANVKANRNALVPDAEKVLAGVSVRKALDMIQQAESNGKHASVQDDARPSRSWKSTSAGTHTAGWNDALTPVQILDAVTALFGEIDLDPCAVSDEPRNVPAKSHYTLAENGLATELAWSGRVFIHPPMDTATQWIDRTLREHEDGTISEAVLLLPVRTDVAWFRSLNGFAIAFLHDRLRVKLSGKEAEKDLPEPMMLVFIGSKKRINDFASAVDEIASVFRAVVQKEKFTE